MEQEDKRTQELPFPNGNRARLVVQTGEETPGDILSALGLTRPRPLVLLAGGAGELDPSLEPSISKLLSAVARAAQASGAAVIDGGTHTGVMKMMGTAVSAGSAPVDLLGVVPAGRAIYPGAPHSDGRMPLDPNHSHFVLANSDEWGGETPLMHALAAELAAGFPRVAILIDGGAIAKDEALRSVREGMPLLVIRDSGRTADDVAQEYERLQGSRRRKDVAGRADPSIEEISSYRPEILSLQLPEGDLERRVAAFLRPDPTLRRAWEQFALYDSNATRQQRSFRRSQLWILALGVIGTVLALAQATLQRRGVLDDPPLVGGALRSLLVAIPIVISALIAASGRFVPGRKWVMLRAGAEAIKREIYRYRARAGGYADRQRSPTNPESLLAQRLKSITQNLMQTDVNLDALRPYNGSIPPRLGKGDNGFSPLSPDGYLEARVSDQINWYRVRSTRLASKLKRLRWAILLIGGAGTFLAAIGFEIWIALTTAITAALVTHLEYEQVESTLAKYNQAAVDLDNLRAWWESLPIEERHSLGQSDRLITSTEQILRAEQTGWVQEMQDALEHLRAEQAAAEEPRKKDR